MHHVPKALRQSVLSRGRLGLRGTVAAVASRESHAPAHRRSLTGFSRHGFTLIELLVSIVILSTGIVLVLEAFQTAMTALGQSRDLMLLDMLARERIAAIELDLAQYPATPPESTSGRFSEEFKGFDWSQRVASDTGGAPPPSEGGRVYNVVINVGRTGDRRGYALSTSYFVPAEKKKQPPEATP